MPWEAWITLGIVLLMAAALVRNIAGPDVVLMGGLTLLMTLSLSSDKFPSPAVAVADFGNEGLITIAVLFVVAQGLSLTGAMGLISQPLLGRPRTVLRCADAVDGPRGGHERVPEQHTHRGDVHPGRQRLV